MRILSRVLPVVMVTCLMSAVAHAQFTPLVKYVPSTANTIILLNAEKVFTSEAALRGGWRQNFQKAIEAGLTRLPSDTQQYVLASQMDFEYMDPTWQVGVLATKTTHRMAQVAKDKGGKLDTVVGHRAALMPTGAYVIQVEPNLYAAMTASRQAVTRWIQTAEEGGVTLSKYLSEAIGYAEGDRTEIIMAMDLADVLDLARVKDRLEESDAIAKKELDREKVAAVLMTLRGAMLGITISDKPYGMMKIDFGTDASLLKEVAKSLILETLANHGAMIEDFENWEASVEGPQITFGGYLSPTGRRQIFSLIDAPSTAAIEPQQKEPGQDVSPSEAPPVEVATQRYFKSITDYMSDLRNKEPQRIAQYGIWFDKYARKIDGLPMVNVDDYALDFGAYVSQQFRNAGAAIQGIGIRSRVRQVENVNAAGGPGYYGANYYGGGYSYGGYYYHGGYGGTFARTNAMQAGLRQQQRVRTEVKVQEKAAGTSAARAIMQDLNNATAQVRRELTKKYNVEF